MVAPFWKAVTALEFCFILENASQWTFQFMNMYVQEIKATRRFLFTMNLNACLSEIFPSQEKSLYAKRVCKIIKTNYWYLILRDNIQSVPYQIESTPWKLQFSNGSNDLSKKIFQYSVPPRTVFRDQKLNKWIWTWGWFLWTNNRNKNSHNSLLITNPKIVVNYTITCAHFVNQFLKLTLTRKVIVF